MEGKKIMLYTIECPIDRKMKVEGKRKAVAFGIRKALATGNEVRFSKDYSIWKSGTNLVLCAYGYKPHKVNIKDMTFEDVVDEIIEAFNFND